VHWDPLDNFFLCVMKNDRWLISLAGPTDKTRFFRHARARVRRILYTGVVCRHVRLRDLALLDASSAAFACSATLSS
jgi:hypothetical protein